MIEESDRELFEHHRISVDEGQSLLRVDKFLIDKLAHISRNRIQLAIKGGLLKVNDTLITKTNYKVKPLDELVLYVDKPFRKVELVSDNIPLDIVYEDAHVLVVNKPSDMVVHPGYGNYRGTLINAVLYHLYGENLPENYALKEDRVGLAHRIDKHTTGLLVLAKDTESLYDLAQQFYNKTTKRIYSVLVWGDVEQDEGTIDTYLCRNPKNRKIMTTTDDSEKGKRAITHWKVKERFFYTTLLSCQLETGRTHQIRAHMQSIRHPVFNDSEYGGKHILKGYPVPKYKQFVQKAFEYLPGQTLHAEVLGFRHPKTKKYLEFKIPPPHSYVQLLEKWKNYATFTH